MIFVVTLMVTYLMVNYGTGPSQFPRNEALFAYFPGTALLLDSSWKYIFPSSKAEITFEEHPEYWKIMVCEFDIETSPKWAASGWNWKTIFKQSRILQSTLNNQI